jgi:hypothetical protein
MNEIESILNRVPRMSNAMKRHLTKLGKDFKKMSKEMQQDIIEAAILMRAIGMKTRSETEGRKEAISEILKNSAKTMYSDLPDRTELPEYPRK